MEYLRIGKSAGNQRAWRDITPAQSRVRAVAVLLLTVGLIACSGGGGGGSPEDGTNNPQNGSWDEMTWDEINWS
jgi:hypothetical protein